MAGSYGNHFPPRPSQAFPQWACRFCPRLGFVAVISTMTKCNLREGKVDFSYGPSSRAVSAGSQRQELQQRPWRTLLGGGWGLLPGSPSIFLSETAQTYLLKDDPADSGLLPSTSISNQGCSRDIPKAYLLEAAPQVRVLPSSHVSLICVRLPDDTNYDNFAFPQTVYKGSNFSSSTPILVTYCFILTILVVVI